MKISDIPLPLPPFFKQPDLFYQTLHFYGKNLNPSPPFLKKRFENSPPPLSSPYKGGGGGGVGGPIML